MVEYNSGDITEEEAALYDRQIRLWGLDAQKRLRAARVLLIHMGGLGAEVAKNLILAGVKSLTMLDNTQVTTSEASCQFFVPRDKLGENRAVASVERAQRLNPMVEVKPLCVPASDLTEESVSRYDVLVATGCPDPELVRLNALCRRRRVLFYAGDVYGFYGLMFADLATHEYAEEVLIHKPTGDADHKRPHAEPETRTVKRSLQFCPLDVSLGVDWTSEERLKSLKKTSDIYFIMRILQAFREETGRRPVPVTADEDAALLLRLRDALPPPLAAKVPDHFTSRCLGELSPVCAVVGGVLAQEVIKAVSKKDKPLANFFLFNGYNSEGVVENISG